MIGIEELVVVDLRGFAKDPLPAGLVVGLRRAALDLVAQGVLALIGVGQIGVVQNDQAGREKHAGQQQRQRNAVQAEAAGLERDELVVFGHHSEGDQHGHERGQRRELVEQIAGEIQKILSDFDEAGAMLRDIVQQFEKCEDLEEQNKSDRQQHEIIEEAAQQIHVQKLGNPGPAFSSW